MTSQKNDEGNTENVIGDLKVLCDKCNRDVDNKYPFNYEHYLGELNRIITILKRILPEWFKDISLVEDAAFKSFKSGSMTGEQDAKLREISAVADKLLSRCNQTTVGEAQPLEILENIFNHFHQVTRQLRIRHDSRETLDVKDEYDVQDLLHALLRMCFDDIRPEEWTPSYAGGSRRMDFLLKNERLVVEVKKARDTLRDKNVGEQLIIDSVTYRAHPDCKTLVCFVYDPEGLISNPTGIENDLSKLSDDELKIRVYVAPK